MLKEPHDSLPEGDPSQDGFVFLLMLLPEASSLCAERDVARAEEPELPGSVVGSRSERKTSLLPWLQGSCAVRKRGRG